MNQDKKERDELLKRLQAKLNEMKKSGKNTIAGQNLRKLKKMKKPIIREVPKIIKPKEEKKLNPVLKGIVKWFNEGRGYGFISSEGKKKDYFVHESNISEKIRRNFKEGTLVEFEAKETDRGVQAVKVIKQNDK